MYSTSFGFLPRQRFLLAALLIALLVFLIPRVAHAAVPNEDAAPAYAEEQTIMQTEKDVPEPGWGSAASGKLHVDRHYLGQYGASEGTVILQRGGNDWRNLRNGPFASFSGFLLLVVPLLLFGFYYLAGPARIEHPETGRQIQRFTVWERTLHWATAISFLIMAFTGLIILFGKILLRPWMGAEIFSWLAIIAKYLHNFVGPLFIVCSVLLFAAFVRRNVFRRWDWEWIRKGGGLASHKHVAAGFFNAGEKLWFWGGLVLLGLLMSLSGLVLDFVTFGQTRYVLQWANYLHLVGATLYIGAAMGHIYIGTIGTPGAYHAMRRGTVDEEWARSHHEYWYNAVRSGSGPEGPEGPPAGTIPPGAAPRPGH